MAILVYEGRSRFLPLFIVFVFAFLGCEDKALTEADALFKQGAYAKAAEAYTTYATSNPEKGRAIGGLLSAGWASYRDGNFSGAITRFEQIQDDYSEEPIAKWMPVFIGYAYYNLNHDEKARDAFMRAYSESPNGVFIEETIFMLGKINQKIWEFDEAETFYMTLASNYAESPYAPAALYQIGMCYLQQNDFEAAEEKFAKVIERYPASSYAGDVRLYKGSAHEGLENYEDALPIYEGVAKDFAGTVPGYEATSRLANYYLSMGDEAKARPYLMNLVSAEHERYTPSAAFQLAFIAHKRNAYETSVKYLEPFITGYRRAIERPDALALLYTVYEKMMNDEKAGEVKRVFEEEYPDYDINIFGGAKPEGTKTDTVGD